MTFIPAHLVLGDPHAPPERTVFVLHGIFGSARNWRSFGGDLAARLAGTRTVLVDLRNHGASLGAAPPHTLAACVEDLDELGAALGGPPGTLIGHSFGGKVAMAYAASHPERLRSLWVLDSPPGAAPKGGLEPRGSEVGRVLAILRSIPIPVARRTAVTERLVREGIARPVATWMATNLHSGRDGGYVWHFDLDHLAEMLADYWRYDAWPLLEHPPAGLEIHVVVAGRSDRWAPTDQDRLRLLAAEGRIALHVLERAGHWLHVDDPEGLLALLAGRL